MHTPPNTYSIFPFHLKGTFFYDVRNSEDTGGTKEEASDKEEVAIDVAQENDAETPQEEENSEEQPQSEVKPGIASESGEVAGNSENSMQQKSAYVVADNVKDTSDVANPDQDVVDPGANNEEAQKKVYGYSS